MTLSCSEELQVGDRVRVLVPVEWSSWLQWIPTPGCTGIVVIARPPDPDNCSIRVHFEEAIGQRDLPFFPHELERIRPNDWENDLELV